MRSTITPSGRFIGGIEVDPTDDKRPVLSRHTHKIIQAVCWAALILCVLWAFAQPQLPPRVTPATTCYQTGC